MIAAVRVMQKENVVIPFLFIAVSLYKYMLCYLRLPPKKHAFGIGMEMNWYMTVFFQQ